MGRAVRRGRVLGVVAVVVATTIGGVGSGSRPAQAAMQPGNEIVQFGSNISGQTGDGTPLGARWTQISAGGSHTLALRNDGTVWAWGRNVEGQLGNNTTTQSLTPVQVLGPGGAGLLTGITQISAGGSHSLARRNDGTVWTWGYNFNGQLGNNTTTTSLTPVQVVGPGAVGFLTGITQISAGGNHSIARKSDGTVWAWGFNGFGQLGNNTTTQSLIPVQVLGPGAFGFNTGTRWTQISAGGYYSLGRRSDGTVWAWGWNFYGELGDGTLTQRNIPVQVVGPGGIGFLTGITQISAGYYHSIARKSDGTVWAWGNNFSGQLGNNTTTQSLTPVQVLGPGGAGLLTGITQISAGGGHSLARRNDGTVWAWGDNNEFGALSDVPPPSKTPVQVVGVTRAIAVAAGGAHSVVLRSPSLGASPGSISFGTVRTNATLTSTPVTITNTDTVTVIVNGVTPTGTDAAAFDPIGPSLPATLAPGQSITLTVTATTDATARTYTAQLTLDTDQPEPLVVPIALKAVDPTWTVGPASLSFPATAVGTTSAPQDVTVANTGPVPISMTNAQFTGTNFADFTVASNNCPAVLAPGASCLIGVAAHPLAAATLSASLRVSTDAGVKTVGLTGAAKNPADVNLWLNGPTTATAATAFATTVNVTNLGPTPAKGVQVVLNLGAGGTFTSVSASGYTCVVNSATQRTCTRSFIANAATANITINATYTAGARTITASVSTLNTIDPDPSDNTDTRNITVT